jgi:hypothetical protein
MPKGPSARGGIAHDGPECSDEKGSGHCVPGKPVSASCRMLPAGAEPGSSMSEMNVSMSKGSRNEMERETGDEFDLRTVSDNY